MDKELKYMIIIVEIYFFGFDIKYFYLLVMSYV